MLNIIYFFIKLLPTRNNRILFLSRQTNKPSIDFRMIINEIKTKEEDYEIITITKKIEKKPISFFLKTFIDIFKQMYYLSTSKVCIIDGYNLSVSVLKHKNNLRVIQIWHSLGAIKKFGKQVLYNKRKKKIAKLLHMHENYDLIISSSFNTTRYFSEAFGYNKDKILTIGLPRIDYLYEKETTNKDKIYLKYPSFKKKKIILYAPTFRKSNHDYPVDNLIKELDLKKYILIVKMHPCVNNYKISNNVYTCDEFSTLQLLSVADIVITDYSAVSLEAAVLDKPTYIYAYDIEEYSKYPGLNVNLEKEFKNYFFKDAHKLCKSIDKKKYDKKIIKKYKEKYIENKDEKRTKLLANKIVEMSGYSVEEIKDNVTKYS